MSAVQRIAQRAVYRFVAENGIRFQEKVVYPSVSKKAPNPISAIKPYGSRLKPIRPQHNDTTIEMISIIWIKDLEIISMNPKLR